MCKLRESFFAFGMFELRSFPQIENLTNFFPIRELWAKSGLKTSVSLYRTTSPAVYGRVLFQKPSELRLKQRKL
jgi:hypothetical protein